MNPIYIINGPNLNMLGIREPEKYGSLTIDDLEEYCHKQAKQYRAKIIFCQSNFEGEIIELLHEAHEKASAVIINPAAFTHYSIAIKDALRIVECPKIEVHLTNLAKRSKYRQTSVTAEEVDAVISGIGYIGYGLAIKAATELI